MRLAVPTAQRLLPCPAVFFGWSLGPFHPRTQHNNLHNPFCSQPRTSLGLIIRCCSAPAIFHDSPQLSSTTHLFPTAHTNLLIPPPSKPSRSNHFPPTYPLLILSSTLAAPPPPSQRPEAGIRRFSPWKQRKPTPEIHSLTNRAPIFPSLPESLDFRAMQRVVAKARQALVCASGGGLALFFHGRAAARAVMLLDTIPAHVLSTDGIGGDWSPELMGHGSAQGPRHVPRFLLLLLACSTGPPSPTNK